MEDTNIQEHDDGTQDNHNDTGDRLKDIIDHIQKPKKLVLPKGYLRPRNTQVDFSDIQDNLSVDSISSNKENDIKIVNILEPSESVKKDAKKNKEKKTRNPTAYNIFVKETVIKLTETHSHLTPKERFKLAIAMWSENKPKK